MLIHKQRCLAENSLGMRCHCQALSGGRCRFHNTVLSGRTSLRQRLAPRLSGFVASFAVWRELFASDPARGLRQTPAAFNL